MLRAERDSKGLTAQELSIRLRMHPTYVSRVERGYRSVDLVELLDILKAMESDPKTFLIQFLDEARPK